MLSVFCRFIQGFALLNLGLVMWAGWAAIPVAGRVYGWADANVLLLVQSAVSLAMFYAASQTLAGREIGQKTLPAALVSYLLWLGMARFWWFATS